MVKKLIQFCEGFEWAPDYKLNLFEFIRKFIWVIHLRKIRNILCG